MNIFWFRRDLRLEDNTGLNAALDSGEEILPVFIFDSNIIADLPRDDARITFIYNLLKDINTELSKHQKTLAVFHGKPEDIFNQLIRKHDIKSVFTNHDYEPYSRKRDKEIGELLKGNTIDFYTFKDQVIFEKDEVVKDDGAPYVVFTPYSNKWLAEFGKLQFQTRLKAINYSLFAQHSYPFLSLKDIGFTESGTKPERFDISSGLLNNYEHTRNFPAVEGTSRLSPYLRFGAVSIRNVALYAAEAGNATFLKELIWREFFMQILWHFPQTVTKAFRPKYDAIQWRNNEAEFKAWCGGKTGYPLVDAGMRQLNQTGFMHNRVRMVTASFLCKHLLIDWRWGEAYFAEKLLDYEQSSNVGNWQWAAGSGVDAAPYFRIFNPTEQAKKFDKDLEYIKRWVPEYQEIDYQPIVNHQEARERALKAYKAAVA